MNRLSTSEEIRRLVEMQPKDFLKEFTETRERFRTFLRNSGISVPDIMADDASTVGQDRQNSVLLDDFSLETISSIDNSIYSVFSTAGAFVKLFDKIPHSSVLKHITVTVEGKEPLTAKELNSKVGSNEINSEEQIVVASSELRSLLPDLGGKAKPSGKSKAPEPVVEIKEEDLKSLLEPAVPKEETPEEVPAGEENEGEISEAEILSPLISQEDYDLLMSGGTPAKKEDAQVENAEQAPAAVIPPAAPQKPAMPSLKIGKPKTDLEAESGAEPVVPATADFTENPDSKENKELSQKELDELFRKDTASQKKPEPVNISQDELEALLSDTKPETNTNKMSQEELDAYLAGEPAKDSASPLTQDELDALLVGGKPVEKKEAPAPVDTDAKSSIGQDEIDQLLNAMNEQEPPKENKPLTLSQDELDDILADTGPSPSPGGAVMDSKELEDFLSSDRTSFKPTGEEKDLPTLIAQDEIDEMLKAPPAKAAVPAPVAPAPPSAAETFIAQDEIDEILRKDAAPELPVKKEEIAVSQDEIEKILQAKELADDGTIKGEKLEEIISTDFSEFSTVSYDEKEFPLNISQDELDNLIAKSYISKVPEVSAVDASPEDTGISDDEINAILRAETGPEQKGDGSSGENPESADSMMSQDELDKLFNSPPEAGGSKKENAGNELLSKDEIDKLFS